MSEQLWAVVEDTGEVSNVLVGDQDFIDQLRADIAKPDVDTGDYHHRQEFIDVTDLDPQPGVGWLHLQGTFMLRTAVTVDRDTIPADGTTAATVTYKDNTPGATGSVVFDVNGVAHDPLPLAADGTASIQVVSESAGDRIRVACGDAGASIEVTPV